MDLLPVDLLAQISGEELKDFTKPRLNELSARI